MKGKSKTIELFLALGLAASVAACGSAPEGGEAVEEPDTTEQAAPDSSESDEGGEGGEGGGRLSF